MLLSLNLLPSAGEAEAIAMNQNQSYQDSVYGTFYRHNEVRIKG